MAVEIRLFSLIASLPFSSFLSGSMTGNNAIVFIPLCKTSSISFKISFKPYLLMLGIESIGSDPSKSSLTNNG